MQVLAVDVGTGTQDVFLFRSGLSLENGFKLVLPSPTMIVRRQILQAARRRQDILLTGVTMGGGPSQWGVEALRRSGGRAFATPAAARSFNDDLEEVERELGVHIVSEDEAERLRGVVHIPLADIDFAMLERAFGAFGVELRPAAVAVAVFDHGAAPPGVSDRQFRFDYLEARVRTENRLSAFAYRAEAIPQSLTRLQAVAASAASLDCPLIVMDTAPAAVLGAEFDPLVAGRPRRLVVNVGNFHALAFRLGPAGIEALFEHHTGLLDRRRLGALIERLAAGTLTRQEVFDNQGHGALVFDPTPLPLDGPDFGIVVTGPRRGLLRGSELRPYFAVPFGDMMLAGCFGLLAAAADLVPELAEPIRRSLRGQAPDVAPWDVE
ncbi:MAG: DUF1786 family protein, partial [Chloroflexota bacterium]